ncbi:hypothetical protein LXL04_008512 [Taraxacum kok-saghyz]
MAAEIHMNRNRHPLLQFDYNSSTYFILFGASPIANMEFSENGLNVNQKNPNPEPPLHPSNSIGESNLSVPHRAIDFLNRISASFNTKIRLLLNAVQSISQINFLQSIFHVLAALYGVVTIVALVQLIRIQLRVPEYGWTTQKVFHFLNVLVNGVRCLIFLFHRDVQQLKPEIVQHILLDVPKSFIFTNWSCKILVMFLVPGWS